MTHLTTLLTLLLTLHLQASTLRISLVVEKDTPNSSKFTQTFGEDTREVHILNTPIITEKDIKNAEPDEYGPGMLRITLNPEGAKKLETATRKLIPGRSQLATIINGKLINAATLQANVLSKRFVISGLDNHDFNIDKLVANLMGRKYTPPTLEEQAAAREAKEKKEIRRKEIKAATKGIKPRLKYEFGNLRKGHVSEIELIEHLQIPDPMQPINQTDFSIITYPFIVLQSRAENDPEHPQTINAQCDTLKILEIHFPEIKKLTTNKKEIEASKIFEIIDPYLQEWGNLPKTIHLDLNPGYEHLIPKTRKQQ